MIIIIWSIVIMIITGLAVWFDYRAYQHRVRALMIVLSGLLIIGFVVQPKWLPSESENFALITEGHNFEGFNQNSYEGVFSLRDEDKYSTNYTWLSSPSMIIDEIPSGSRVDLYGFGVSEDLPSNYQWFDKLQDPGNGLVVNSAPNLVEVGKKFDISITAYGADEEDSIEVYRDGEFWKSQKVDSNSMILVQDQLKIQGPVTYEFDWMHMDSLYTENLIIRAVKPKLLTFGVLTYSPSFEINYLTEHFGGRGHSVISRVRVGKEQFRYDAVNARVNQAESFIENMNSMDVLILDAREYMELSISEKERITEAVENGLDVLLRSPEIKFAQQWGEVFSEISDETVNVQTVDRLEERNWLPDFLQDREEIVTPSALLNIDIIDLPETSEALHKSTSNETVSLRIQNNSGSVTGHLFYQTYPWLIEGEEEVYNSFWVAYLSRVITFESSQIEIIHDIPRANEKMKFFITQPLELTHLLVKPVFSSDSLRIPISQNPENLSVAEASFWPKEVGWHFAEYGELKTWFYVYANQWEFDAQVTNYEWTKMEIQSQRSVEISEDILSRAKVPDWLWLSGFLVLQIFLWTERKLT